MRREIDWLTDKAEQAPGETFLIQGDEPLSYLEVAERVADRVAVLGDRSGTQLVVKPRMDVESVVELLAVPMTGATAVVVAPERPDTAFLVEQALSDRRPAHTILFTSGSSGEPKGVRLSADNWDSAARASAEHLGHRSGQRWLCVLPLHHVGGLSIIYRALFSGGAVVLESDPDLAARWLDRVEWASLVPTQLYRILSKRTDSFTSSPRVLLGGGPADSVLIERGLAAGLEVLGTFGMTETTSQVATAQQPGGPLMPLPGVDIDIDATSRIRVRGSTVMLGYVGKEELDGEFLTSDRGRIHPDGSLQVLGRVDRVIITGGEKVDPSSVEALVAGQRGVSEVAVLGIPDPEWGERVVALLVGDAHPSDLVAALRLSVPPFAIPKQWVRVGAIPRTDLGKFDMNAAIALFNQTTGDASV
ncbi:MAG TPA: AMP-binding protein [Acidimicrobiia bacterium]|nr:AMP-binding protein [Acidimicrobiia bacterium]